VRIVVDLVRGGLARLALTYPEVYRFETLSELARNIQFSFSDELEDEYEDERHRRIIAGARTDDDDEGLPKRQLVRTEDLLPRPDIWTHSRHEPD
jgi:hypothetical protein